MEKCINIYIDKDKTQIFSPMIQCKIGYLKAIEPWKIYGAEEWDDIAPNIIKMLEWLETEEFSEEFLEKISDLSYNVFRLNGIKSFKRFSAKHICIKVWDVPDSNEIKIHNYPRLSDGSYGINKDFTQEYSKTYTCNKNVDEIRTCFEKAMCDARDYLDRIHSTL